MSKPTRPQLPHVPARKVAVPSTSRPAVTQPTTRAAGCTRPAPGVLQPKAPAVRQTPVPTLKAAPAAPPVYRPQTTPKVLQRKASPAQPSPANSTNRQPAAPAVYRPQPTPKVLQRKADVRPQCPPPSPRTGPAAAPPVYRPQPTPHVLQRKGATPQPPPAGVKSPRPSAPPASRPAPRSVAQPKAAVAVPGLKTPNARGTVIQRVIKEASEDVKMQVMKELGNAAGKINACLSNSHNERYMSKLQEAAHEYLAMSTTRQIEAFVLPKMQMVADYLSDNRFSLYRDTNSDAVAYVYPNDMRSIYLGKSYKGIGYSREDSVAGALIHEITHLVLDTDDHAYGNEGVEKLVKADNKKQAKTNADNWERFFESLIFY